MISVSHVGYYWFKEWNQQTMEQNATILAEKMAAAMKKTEATPVVTIEKEKLGE